jgi:predicted nucleotidyltransferase/HEPN domain-containing protein
MKNTLTHLPQIKQTELNKIAETIRKNCSDAEKIILFGSYARGDYKEEKDLHKGRKSGHVSDYDVLVVTSKKDTALDSMLWKKIADECQKLNLSAYPKFLTHDIEALNIKLAEGQYFYSEVIEEGILIFESGKFKFAQERNLTTAEIKRRAQDHFDEWFQAAESFFKIYNFCLNENDLKRAAFSLHQSAESSYKTVLLVFANESPNEHFLAILGAEAEKYCHLLQNIFAKISKEDEARFKLLEYAYIGGRYDPNYRITKEDLEILAVDVKKLLELTKKVCEEKIGSF